MGALECFQGRIFGEMVGKLWKVYSNHLNIRLVWYSDGRFVSGCQVVWYLKGGLKSGLKKSLFMIQNVCYSNGLLSHMTLPFKYSTPILSIIQMNLVFMCSVFR